MDNSNSFLKTIIRHSHAGTWLSVCQCCVHLNQSRESIKIGKRYYVDLDRHTTNVQNIYPRTEYWPIYRIDILRRVRYCTNAFVWTESETRIYNIQIIKVNAFSIYESNNYITHTTGTDNLQKIESTLPAIL